MTKQHRHELAPARHAFGVLLALMTGDCLLENAARYQPDDLAEDAAYSFHGRVILL
jgi:hypothetical protein